MITIESPSMAINDNRAPATYQMDHTERVNASTSIQSIVNKVVAAARLEPLGRLQNLVLLAHGAPATYQLGTGLNMDTMGPFAAIRGKVHKIWFKGCLVARIAGPHTASHGDGVALKAYGITSGDGHRFISAFARLTGCYVVASTEIQGTGRSRYPRGLIDSYEGLVLSYNPQGAISWQHRYASLYGHNPQNRTASSPNPE